MATTQYFPHYSNARNDEKVLALRMKHGMEGYGVFFAILERLLDSTDYRLSTNYNLIAFDFRVGNEVIKSIVEDYGLFEFTEDHEYFYSVRFLEHMDYKDDISKKRAEAGRKGGLNKAKKQQPSKSLANAKQTSSIKRNETKPNQTKPNETKQNIKAPKGALEGCALDDGGESNPFVIVKDAWNGLDNHIPKLEALNTGTKRYNMLNARINQYGLPEVLKAIKNVSESDFLKGYATDFTISFDWFIRPNNFIKVLEGNYANKATRQGKKTDQQAYNDMLGEWVNT